MVRLITITLAWQEASIVFQGTKSNFSYSGKVPAIESDWRDKFSSFSN